MNKKQQQLLLLLLSSSVFASHLREMCQKINVTLAHEHEKAMRERPNFPPPQLLSTYQKPTVSADGKTITYATGLKIKISPLYEGADKPQYRMERDSQGIPSVPRFSFPTNRDYKKRAVESYPYPAFVLALDNLKGKKVLDMGVGGGQFVIDLRAKGIQAYGTDIVLDKNLKAQPHIFIEADNLKTGLAPEQFDVIFNSWASLYYEPQLFRQQMEEIKSLLKERGTLNLSPPLLSKEIEELKKIRGLKLIYHSKTSSIVERTE